MNHLTSLFCISFLNPIRAYYASIGIVAKYLQLMKVFA
ncbi:hypothetical protein THOB06_230087 [Vibrio rotiferianus]|nr:hypothetical protein THOG10_230087 [Vibrio rotiferianus]CAH1577572.1 hypothetical protein THOB06_230087 [Vibrio rotiferianus]